MEKLRQKEENGKENGKKTQLLQNFYCTKTKKKKMKEKKCQNSNSSFFKSKWKVFFFSFSEVSGLAKKSLY